MTPFKAHDTHGIPIQETASALFDRGLFVDWKEFMREAIIAGWTYDKIKSTIHSVNDEFFGKEWQSVRLVVPKMFVSLCDELNMEVIR